MAFAALVLEAVAMIPDAIIHGVLSLLQTIIGVLPTIPQMSTSITSASAWLTDMLSKGVAFADLLYGTVFFDAVLAIIAAVWVFEPAYHALMWVLRKIPFLGIS